MTKELIEEAIRRAGAIDDLLRSIQMNNEDSSLDSRIENAIENNDELLELLWKEKENNEQS